MSDSGSNFKHRVRQIAVTILVLLLAGILIWSIAKTGHFSPPEPVYQGMTLRQWLTAEPHLSVTSHEDIMSYRRSARSCSARSSAGG